MNSTTHPIEFALACLVNLFEFACFLINEAAGFHKTSTSTEQLQVNKVNITPLNSEDCALQVTQIRQQQYQDLVQSYTVKQLRQLTGIKSKRWLKADLQLLAFSASV